MHVKSLFSGMPVFTVALHKSNVCSVLGMLWHLESLFAAVSDANPFTVQAVCT